MHQHRLPWTYVRLPHKVLEVGHLGGQLPGGWLASKEGRVGSAVGGLEPRLDEHAAGSQRLQGARACSSVGVWGCGGVGVNDSQGTQMVNGGTGGAMKEEVTLTVIGETQPHKHLGFTE